jgi:chromosome segregation ATPase
LVTHDANLKKLLHSIQEIPGLHRDIRQEASNRDKLKVEVRAEISNFKISLKDLSVSLNHKIDGMSALEERIRMIEKQCEYVQDIALNTKQDITKTLSDKKEEDLELMQKLQRYEGKLDATIQDTKFWLTKYTDTFAKHDKEMLSIKEELNGRLNTTLEQLRRRVTIKDMKLNFKSLNDLLLVKF